MAQGTGGYPWLDLLESAQTQTPSPPPSHPNSTWLLHRGPCPRVFPGLQLWNGAIARKQRGQNIVNSLSK